MRVICFGALLAALAAVVGCGRGNAATTAVARLEATSGPGAACRTTAPPEHPVSLHALGLATSVASGEPAGLATGGTCVEHPDETSIFLAAADPAPDPADRPWRQRRGAPRPGRFWASLGADALEWPETLVDDVGATATNSGSLVLFAAAGAGGAALANSDADDKVNDHYEKHGAQLGSLADDFGEVSGSALLHFALAGGTYLTALAFEDDQTYRSAKTMINALTLTGVTTLGLKAAVGKKRPGGTRGGWPSGHASSSFCFATVICHEYGPWPGAGAYALATFTAYQRVDSQYHYLSDVVSGAIIGVAFGHAVAGNHKLEVLGMDVVPYVHPRTGATGLALTKQW